MPTAEELKSIFRKGWNIPTRVDNYVRNVADGEFSEDAGLPAWRECLASVLPAGERLAVLDMGTGPGIFACLYAQLGHECTGLDFSRRMLKVATRRAADLGLDCSFILADAENPPFDADSFDVISSRHLLFNLPRPGVAVRQWIRLLKPGAKLILMGDDSAETTVESLSHFVRRRLRHFRHNSPRGNKPGWRPSADYLNAVSQCPLFRQGKGPVIAVMQAAGLENIESLPTEAIHAARRNKHAADRNAHFAPSQPYVLIGTKPE